MNKVTAKLRELSEAFTEMAERRERAHDEYVGRKVYGRKGTEYENVYGVVTNTSLCGLAGCGGTRLHVKWPDGKRTYPCAKGCSEGADGSLRID
jgi:hypothetical protein